MNYYALASRSLIALLFVVAGIQKAMHFQATSETVTALGIPMAAIVTVIVILIEVPIALAFAWGYYGCIAGWILVGFTAITTVVVHHDLNNGINMVNALKNLAIIGGLMLAVKDCSCKRCKID